MKLKKPFNHKLSVLAVALSCVFPQAGFAEVLDFKMCVDKTLNQNPEMRISNARIQQAESSLTKAEASRLPQINLSMTAANSNNPLNVFGMKLQQRSVVASDMFVPNDASMNTTPLNEPDAHTDFNTRLEMLIPIWNGGKIGSYENQAKAMIEAARHGDVAVQQFLTFGVYQAYEAVHAARSFITVAEQAKVTADAFVKTTHNLVEQGVVVRSEYLSAKVHQASAEVALMQAQGQEQIALDSLRMLMNLDASESLDVADRKDLELPADTVQELIGMALSNNPQLGAKRKEASSSVAAIDAAKADYYPSFNIMLRNDWNDEQLGVANSSYTVAGVAAWKITDFGVTKGSVGMANAEATQKQESVHSEENKVRLEVLTAWHRLQIALKKVRSDILAVQQAQEAQELIMKRYENGVSTMTEVLASQTQLDKARADLVAAKYEANVQKATLRLATGTMDLASL